MFDLAKAIDPAALISNALVWVAAFGALRYRRQNSDVSLAYLCLAVFTVLVALFSPTSLFGSHAPNLAINLGVGTVCLIVLVVSLVWATHLMTPRSKGHGLRWAEAVANLFIGTAAMAMIASVLLWTPRDRFSWLNNSLVQSWTNAEYHGLLYALPYLLVATLVVAVGETGSAVYRWFRRRRSTQVQA